MKLDFTYVTVLIMIGVIRGKLSLKSDFMKIM